MPACKRDLQCSKVESTAALHAWQARKVPFNPRRANAAVNDFRSAFAGLDQVFRKGLPARLGFGVGFSSSRICWPFNRVQSHGLVQQPLAARALRQP